MAKPYTQNQPLKIEEKKELPTVKYLRMAPHVVDGKEVPGSWDLFEGVATCMPGTEQKLESGFGLREVRYAYDVAKAKRFHKRQGDAE